MNKMLSPIFAVLLGLVPAAAVRAQATNDALQLFMPDGQLRSHLIRVYINRDVSESMAPGLVLHAPHALLHANYRENNTNHFHRLSRDARWTETVDGQAEARHGTLLLFDLQGYPIPWYKAMTRITPILVWQDGGQTFSVIGEREVYLANTKATVFWSAAAVLAIGLFIGWMSWHTTCARRLPPLERLCSGLANPDGSLSMWRAQLAAWTAAIGGVVFGFGLIRLEVPDIPETLVALMGLSLATGGLSALKQPPSASAGGGSPSPSSGPAAGHPVTPNPATPALPANSTTRLPMRLSDLITNWNDDTQQREVSVAKSQMVFWTILTLGIFITKSLADGTLWPVPWQLVALMGMSQAGYVAPKFMPKAT